jgi:ribosomal protein L29
MEGSVRKGWETKIKVMSSKQLGELMEQVIKAIRKKRMEKAKGTTNKIGQMKRPKRTIH